VNLLTLLILYSRRVLARNGCSKSNAIAAVRITPDGKVDLQDLLVFDRPLA
jgi:hypothetical protein